MKVSKAKPKKAVKDLKVSKQKAGRTKGGIGLLLPAVQKIRD